MENLQYDYYWITLVLQCVMIIILGGIYDNTKKK